MKTRTKVFFFVFWILTILATNAAAKNWSVDARGQTPAGNWVPIKVDASGNMVLS